MCQCEARRIVGYRELSRNVLTDLISDIQLNIVSNQLEL